MRAGLVWCDVQDPIFPQFSVTGTEVGYPGGKWFNPFSMAATPEKVSRRPLRRPRPSRGSFARTGVVSVSWQRDSCEP